MNLTDGLKVIGGVLLGAALLATVLQALVGVSLAVAVALIGFVIYKVFQKEPDSEQPD